MFPKHARSEGDTARHVVASLGAVPIPTAPKGVPTATGTGSQPALLEMGAPLRVTLPGTTALITATGPTQTTTDSRSTTARTTGVITIDLRPSSGTLAVAAGDFSCHDQTGHLVPLHTLGPARIDASPRSARILRLAERFASGSAALSWRHTGRVLAVWDFTIELD